MSNDVSNRDDDSVLDDDVDSSTLVVVAVVSAAAAEEEEEAEVSLRTDETVLVHGLCALTAGRKVAEGGGVTKPDVHLVEEDKIIASTSNKTHENGLLKQNSVVGDGILKCFVVTLRTMKLVVSSVLHSKITLASSVDCDLMRTSSIQR